VALHTTLLLSFWLSVLASHHIPSPLWYLASNVIHQQAFLLSCVLAIHSISNYCWLIHFLSRHLYNIFWCIMVNCAQYTHGPIHHWWNIDISRPGLCLPGFMIFWLISWGIYILFNIFCWCGLELKINDSSDTLARVFSSCSTTLYSLYFINSKNSLVSSLVTILFTSSDKSTTSFPWAFFFSSSFRVKHFPLKFKPLMSAWKTIVGYIIWKEYP